MRQKTQFKRPKNIKRFKYVWYAHIGIYGIFCQPTQSVYIGQSINVPSRLRSHANALRMGTYGKGVNDGLALMQKDFDNHGSDAFKFTQIAECEQDSLLKLETQYCLQYHKDGFILYNTFLHTENTGLVCPEPFKPIIERIIKLLDRGYVRIDELEKGLDQLEYR